MVHWYQGRREVPSIGKCFEGDEAAAAQPCPTKGNGLASPLTGTTSSSGQHVRSQEAQKMPGLQIIPRNYTINRNKS